MYKYQKTPCIQLQEYTRGSNEVRGKGKTGKPFKIPRKVYLEDGKTGLAEVVKSTTRLLGIIGEATPKNLHSQQGKNEDKENEQDQEGIDGGYGVDQTLDQITHGGPVSGRESSALLGQGARKGGVGGGRGGLRQKLCLLAMNQNDPVAGLQCYRDIMILVLLLILSYLI